MVKFKLCLLLLFAVNTQLLATPRWFALEYQEDVRRKFNTVQVAGLTPLPYDFSLWGFANFETQKGLEKSEDDFINFFSEVDLRTPRWHNWGIVLEHNSFTRNNNDIVRLGLYYLNLFKYQDKLKFLVRIKLFPWESDHEGGQANIFWRLTFPAFLQNRIVLGSFIDWNFKSGDDRITNRVGEIHLRYRFYRQVSAIVEYRRNEFLGGNRDGVGLGLRVYL